MKLLKPLRVKTFFVLTVLPLLFSCSFSTTKTKDPVFAIDLNTVSANIKSLIITQEVNLNGTETKANGKITSELTVRLINARNAPADEAQRDEIGKQVAKLLKQSLKNPNDYTTYKVLFVIQETNGSVTKSNYTGRVYKSEEL